MGIVNPPTVRRWWQSEGAGVTNTFALRRVKTLPFFLHLLGPFCCFCVLVVFYLVNCWELDHKPELVFECPIEGFDTLEQYRTRKLRTGVGNRRTNAKMLNFQHVY